MDEQQQSPQQLMQALMHTGQTQYNLGNYEGAIAAHSEMLAYARKIADSNMEGLALAWLGCELRQKGELEKAVELFEQRLVIVQALNDQAAQRETLSWLGESTRKLGQPEQAIQHYTRQLAIVQAVADQSTEQSLLYILGSIYHDDRQDYTRALSYFLPALRLAQALDQLANTANAHFMLGQTYRNLGRAEKASAYYEKAVVLYTQLDEKNWAAQALSWLEVLHDALERKSAKADASLLVQKGRQQIQVGNYQEALALFNQALALKPDDSDAWYCKSAVLLQLGHHEDALTTSKQSLKLNSSWADPWNIQAHILIKLERSEEALVAFKHSLALNPEDGAIWNKYSVLLFHFSHHQEAILACEEALKITPNDSEYWKNYGQFLSKVSFYEKALDAYSKALEINPNDEQALVNRGSLLANQFALNEEALIDFDRCLSLNPEYVIAWESRGVVLSKLNRHDESANSYRKALELSPDDSKLWKLWREKLEHLKQYKKIISFCEAFLKRFPKNAFAWVCKASALHTLKRYEEAIESCDRALAIDSACASAWYARGRSFFEFGRSSYRRVAQKELLEAVIALKQATILKPNDATYWYTLGNALWHIEKYQESLYAFDRCIELNSNIPMAWKMRALALSHLNRLEETLSSFDQALELSNYQLAEAWGDRGSTVLQLQGFDAAIQNYDDALRHLKPELFDQYQPPDQYSYQEACRSLYATKAKYQYEQGRTQLNPYPYWRKALRSYSRALEGETPFLDTLQETAVVCQGLGRTVEAQELLRQGNDLLERLIHDIPSPRKKVLTARLYAGFNQLRIDQLVSAGHLIEALELMEERKNACLSWSRYEWQETSPTAKYQEIQTLLNFNTAAIYWHLSPAAITLFILRQNTPPVCLIPHYREPYMSFETKAEPEAAAYASRACYLLEQWMLHWKQDYQSYQQDWIAAMPEQLERLAGIVGVPAIMPYLEGVQNLILLPHRDLALLPLHALFPEAVLQRVTISYLPSAQMGLERLRSRQKTVLPSISSTLLNVENPENNLPCAAIESALITKQFLQTQQLQGDDASQNAVFQALSECSGVFHYSGHASHNPKHPAASALHLSNGDRLTLNDLFQLDLSSYALINLSACETGMTSQQRLIDESVGLVSVLLAVGAQAVVSSLWQVNDLSTALFMLKFYERLQPSTSNGAIAVALNYAQQWLRTMTLEQFEQEWQRLQPDLKPVLASMRRGQRVILDESLKQIRQRPPYPFANPYYWAGFTVHGL